MFERRREIVALILLITTIITLSNTLEKPVNTDKISSGEIEKKDGQVEINVLNEEIEEVTTEEYEEQETEEKNKYWDYSNDIDVNIKDKIGSEVKLISNVQHEPEIDGDDIYIQITSNNKETNSSAIVKYEGGKEIIVEKGDKIALKGKVINTFKLIQESGDSIEVPVILGSSIEIICGGQFEK